MRCVCVRVCVVLCCVCSRDASLICVCLCLGTGRVPSAHRPELRIVTTTNEEISSDALSVHGFEAYQVRLLRARAREREREGGDRKRKM